MTSDENIAVKDREELIYLLTEAAEFEHVVMCAYLYAQWSLKKEDSRDITDTEKEAIGRWRASIRTVAMEEMLHLALVNNMMAALGAAPHFARPDFPVRQGYFPSDLDFHLAPFNEQTLQHFVFIERPEGIEVEDGKGFTHESHYHRVVCTDLLSPTARDYASQGHLYHGIAQAIRGLAERIGEEKLFVGHGEAQMTSAEFPLPGLFRVTGVESAMKALEEIVHQGAVPAHRLCPDTDRVGLEVAGLDAGYQKKGQRCQKSRFVAGFHDILAQGFDQAGGGFGYEFAGGH